MTVCSRRIVVPLRNYRDACASVQDTLNWTAFTCWKCTTSREAAFSRCWRMFRFDCDRTLFVPNLLLRTCYNVSITVAPIISFRYDISWVYGYSLNPLVIIHHYVHIELECHLEDGSHTSMKSVELTESVSSGANFSRKAPIER